MFNNSKRENMSETNFGGREGGTVIAHGVRVEGDFSSEGDVVIEGEVHGNVVIAGMLTVGAQARLKADVSAEQAMIAGVVDGNTVIKGHLDLKATAKMTGDLICETVAIESGATLNGKVAVGSAPGKSGKHSEAKASE